MPYQDELSLLCEVFQKNHVGASVIRKQELFRKSPVDRKSGLFSLHGFFEEHAPDLVSHTVYLATDPFELCHRLILLPDGEEHLVLCVGPYLKHSIPPKRVPEIGKNNGISPQKQRYLLEYYASIPVLSDDSPLWSLLQAFCERIWHRESFSFEELSPVRIHEKEISQHPIPRSEPADILVNMKALERRYAFENQIIRAVALGQLHMEQKLRVAFSPKFLEKRISDPLRSAKNYGIIMNTLLRKAAEQGNVHPMYLDRISSDFALKIEEIPSLSHISDLMCEMFREYCLLVRKHATERFSDVVKKALMIIDADLSGDLSPHNLAESLGISLGYLSTVFKRETNKTLTEYIRQCRMEHAAYLLRTTQLQIQTVAFQCGILDVQYFSKIFKKYYGVTPTEYHLTEKHGNP